MRLIDADKLKPDMKVFLSAYAEELTECYSQRRIDNALTIDAEPVRCGKWLYNDIYLPNCAECSECGWKSSVSGDEIPSYHYCPNCGAKMDGGENNA